MVQGLMGQVVPLIQPRHYWQPGQNPESRRFPLPFKFTTAVLNCSRPGLHMDKILAPDLLGHLWPWMREGLAHIRRKNLSSRTTWLPEHVRDQIALGLTNPQLLPQFNRTECFIGHNADDDALQGFLVMYPLVDPFVTLPLAWFVWMASIHPHTLAHILPEFEALARERGYRRWEWTSPRAGWERRAQRFGARVVDRVIGKDLT